VEKTALLYIPSSRYTIENREELVRGKTQAHGTVSEAAGSLSKKASVCDVSPPSPSTEADCLDSQKAVNVVHVVDFPFRTAVFAAMKTRGKRNMNRHAKDEENT